MEKFIIIDNKEETNESYTILWKWDYEGDSIQDTLDSNIGDLSFNIVLTSEYEEIIKTLPRSGDILTNY